MTMTFSLRLLQVMILAHTMPLLIRKIHVRQSQQNKCTQKKKAGPDDSYMRVIGFHQKRPAYPSQSTRFQNDSKYFSALPACVVNLLAYAGSRLASKVTFLIWSIEAIFKPVKRPVLLTCFSVQKDFEVQNLLTV